MPVPDTALPYYRLREILDRALAAERGIELSHENPAALRMALYAARRQARKEAARGHPQGHDATPYDILSFHIHENSLIIRHGALVNLDDLEIKEI